MLKSYLLHVVEETSTEVATTAFILANNYP